MTAARDDVAPPHRKPLGLIGAIARHRADRTLDLVEQIRNRRDIADIVRVNSTRQSRLYRRRPPDEVYASGGMTGRRASGQAIRLRRKS